jgi:hypothetical protein
MRILLLLALLCPLLSAQTHTVIHALDASGAPTTKPCKTGTSPPGTCAVGECFVDTDATAEKQLQTCTSSNTWTVPSGVAGAGSLLNANRFVCVASGGTLKECASSGTTQLGTAFYFDATNLTFGTGTTSSHPMWKRNGVGWEARLADDSDYTWISGAGYISTAPATFSWSGRSDIISEADGRVGILNEAQTANANFETGPINYAAPSGGTDSYSADTGLTSLAAGTQVVLKPDVNNTGAATLDVDAGGPLTAKAIKILSSGAQADPSNDDLDANGMYLLIYDGTVFIAYDLEPSGGSGHTIEDEGTPLTARTKLNFTGAGVTCTDDAGDDASDCDIPGVAAGDYLANQADAFEVTRTDADTLTFNPDCTASAPCNIAGYQFTASGTVDIASGSASDTFYIELDPGTGTIYVQEDGANTITCTGCTGGSGSDFTDGYVRGWAWDVTTGAYDTLDQTFDKRDGLTLNQEVIASTGLSGSWSGDAYTITTDTASIPTLSGNNAFTDNNLFQAGISFLGESDAASDAYVANTTDTAPSALVEGACYSFITDVANTGAATLDIDDGGALAAKDLVQRDGTALITGDIDAGQHVRACYDATADDFQYDQGSGGGGASGFCSAAEDELCLVEEFMSGYAGPGRRGETGMYYAAIGGASTNVTWDLTEDEHPGILEIDPGSGGGGDDAIIYYYRTAITDLDGTTFDVVIHWRMVDTTNVRHRIGLFSSVTDLEPTEGAWIRLDEDVAFGDINFTMEVQTSTDTEIHDTGDAKDIDWHKTRIRSTVAGTWLISHDGGTERSFCTSGCDEAITVPAVNMYVGVLAGQSGATGEDFRIDAFMVKVALNR